MPYGVPVFALEVLVGAAVLLAIAFLATRHETVLDDDGPDRPDIGLPDDRPLRSDDIDGLRFRVVFGLPGVRGYRFDEVDATMARVQETLRAQEAALAARPASLPVPPAEPEPPAPTAEPEPTAPTAELGPTAPAAELGPPPSAEPDVGPASPPTGP
jgi:hypothetical protein